MKKKKFLNLMLMASCLTLSGGVALSSPLLFAGKGDVSSKAAISAPQVDGVYQISTADQLAEIASEISLNGTGADYNYELVADIDLTGKVWTPIGNNTHKFTGSFNGNGYRISNSVEISESVVGGYYGLFGYVENAEIFDIVLDNSYSFSPEGTVNEGTLIGYANNSLVADIYDNSTMDIPTIGVVAGNSKIYKGGFNVESGKTEEDSFTVGQGMTETVEQGKVITFNAGTGRFVSKSDGSEISTVYKVLMKDGEVKNYLDGNERYGLVFPADSTSKVNVINPGYGLNGWKAGETPVTTLTDASIALNNYVVNADWQEIIYTLNIHEGGTGTNTIKTITEVKGGALWKDIIPQFSGHYTDRDLTRVYYGNGESEIDIYTATVKYDTNGNKIINGHNMSQETDKTFWAGAIQGGENAVVSLGNDKIVEIYTNWQLQEINSKIQYSSENEADVSTITAESMVYTEGGKIELGTKVENYKEFAVRAGVPFEYTLTIPAYHEAIITVEGTGVAGDDYSQSNEGNVYTLTVTNGFKSNDNFIKVVLNRKECEININAGNSNIEISGNSSYTSLSGNVLTTLVGEGFELKFTAKDGNYISGYECSEGISESCKANTYTQDEDGFNNSLSLTFKDISGFTGSDTIIVQTAPKTFKLDFKYNVDGDYTSPYVKPEVTVIAGEQERSWTESTSTTEVLPVGDGSLKISVAESEYYSVKSVVFNEVELSISNGIYEATGVIAHPENKNTLTVTLEKRSYAATISLKGEKVDNSFTDIKDVNGQPITEGLDSIAILTVKPSSSFFVGDTLTLSYNIISEYYEFAGWYYSNGELISTENNYQLTTPASDVTIYGTIKGKTTTITISTSEVIVQNVDGGTGYEKRSYNFLENLTIGGVSKASFSYKYGEPASFGTINYNDLSNKGYTLVGWGKALVNYQGNVLSSVANPSTIQELLGENLSGLIGGELTIYPYVEQKTTRVTFYASDFNGILSGTLKEGVDFDYYYGQQYILPYSTLIFESYPLGYFLYRWDVYSGSGNNLGQYEQDVVFDFSNYLLNSVNFENGFKIYPVWKGNTITISYYEEYNEDGSSQPVKTQEYTVGNGNLYIDCTITGYDVYSWKDYKNSDIIYSNNSEASPNYPTDDLILVPHDFQLKRYNVFLSYFGEPEYSWEGQSYEIEYRADLLTQLEAYLSNDIINNGISTEKEGFNFVGWAFTDFTASEKRYYVIDTEGKGEDYFNNVLKGYTFYKYLVPNESKSNVILHQEIFDAESFEGYQEFVIFGLWEGTHQISEDDKFIIGLSNDYLNPDFGIIGVKREGRTLTELVYKPRLFDGEIVISEFFSNPSEQVDDPFRDLTYIYWREQEYYFEDFPYHNIESQKLLKMKVTWQIKTELGWEDLLGYDYTDINPLIIDRFTSEANNLYRAKLTIGDKTNSAYDVVLYSQEIKILIYGSDITIEPTQENGNGDYSRTYILSLYYSIRDYMNQAASFFKDNPEYDKEGVFTNYSSSTSLSEILEKFVDSVLVTESDFLFKKGSFGSEYKIFNPNISLDEMVTRASNSDEQGSLEFNVLLYLGFKSLFALSMMNEKYVSDLVDFHQDFVLGGDDELILDDIIRTTFEYEITNNDVFYRKIFEILYLNKTNETLDDVILKFKEICQKAFAGTSYESYDYTDVNITISEQEGIKITGELPDIASLSRQEKENVKNIVIQQLVTHYIKKFLLDIDMSGRNMSVLIFAMLSEVDLYKLMENFGGTEEEILLIENSLKNMYSQLFEGIEGINEALWQNLKLDINSSTITGVNLQSVTNDQYMQVANNLIKVYSKISSGTKFLETLLKDSKQVAFNKLKSFEDYAYNSFEANKFHTAYGELFELKGQIQYRFTYERYIPIQEGEDGEYIMKMVYEGEIEYDNNTGSSARPYDGDYNVTFINIGDFQGSYEKCSQYVDRDWSVDNEGPFYDKIWSDEEQKDIFVENPDGSYVKLESDFYRYVGNNGSYEISAIEYVGKGNGNYKQAFEYVGTGGTHNYENIKDVYGKLVKKGESWEVQYELEDGTAVELVRNVNLTEDSGQILSEEIKLIRKEDQVVLFDSKEEGRSEFSLIGRYTYGYNDEIMDDNVQYLMSNAQQLKDTLNYWTTPVSGVGVDEIVLCEGVEWISDDECEFINPVNVEQAKVDLYKAFVRLTFDESLCTDEIRSQFGSYQNYVLEILNKNSVFKVDGSYYVKWDGFYNILPVVRVETFPLQKAPEKMIYVDFGNTYSFATTENEKEFTKTFTQVQSWDTLSKITLTFKTTSGEIGDYSLLQENLYVYKIKVDDGKGNVYTLVNDTIGFKLDETAIDNNFTTITKESLDPNQFYVWANGIFTILADSAESMKENIIEVQGVKASEDLTNIVEASTEVLANINITSVKVLVNGETEEKIISVNGDGAVFVQSNLGEQIFVGEIIGNGTNSATFKTVADESKVTILSYTYNVTDVQNGYYLGTLSGSENFIEFSKTNLNTLSELPATEGLEIVLADQNRHIVVISKAASVDLTASYVGEETPRTQTLYIDFVKDASGEAKDISSKIEIPTDDAIKSLVSKNPWLVTSGASIKVINTILKSSATVIWVSSGEENPSKNYVINTDHTKNSFVEDGEVINGDSKFEFTYNDSITAQQAFAQLKIPTRKGYTFEGWYSDEGLLNKITEDNILKFLNENAKKTEVTIYSKWTINTYEIEIKVGDENGSDADRGTFEVAGQISNSGNVYTFNYFETATITVNAKDYYVFKEARLIDEENEYQILPSEGSSVLVENIAEDYTLSLRFRDVNVVIKTNSEGELKSTTYSYGATEITTSKAKDVLRPYTDKVGYSIADWFYMKGEEKVSVGEKTIKECITDIISGGVVTDNQEFEFFAEWKANEYTIKLYNNTNESDETFITVTVTYGQPLSSAVGYETPVNPGLKLLRWASNRDGSGTSLTPDNNYMIAGATDLYAQWAQDVYNLEINLELPYEQADGNYFIEEKNGDNWSKISSDGEGRFVLNSSKEYRITALPKKGYHATFESIEEEITLSAEGNIATISQIKSNTVVTVRIEASEHTITIKGNKAQISTVQLNGIDAEITQVNGNYEVTINAKTGDSIVVIGSADAGYSMAYERTTVNSGNATISNTGSSVRVTEFNEDIEITIYATPNTYLAKVVFEEEQIESVTALYGSGENVAGGINVTTDVDLKLNILTKFGYEGTSLSIADTDEEIFVNFSEGIYTISGFTKEFTIKVSANPIKYSITATPYSVDAEGNIQSPVNNSVSLSGVTGGKAEYNSDVTFKAEIGESGYTFIGWYVGTTVVENKITNYGTLVSEENPYIHTVKGETNLIGIFKYSKFSVNIKTEGKGTFSYKVNDGEETNGVSGISMTFVYGDKIVVMPTPSKGYLFNGWCNEDGSEILTGDGIEISDEGILTITLKKDINITAKFVAGTGRFEVKNKLYINGVATESSGADFAKVSVGTFDGEAFTPNGDATQNKTVNFTTDVDVYIRVEVYTGYTFEGFTSLPTSGQTSIVADKVKEYTEGDVSYYIYKVSRLNSENNYAPLISKIKANENSIRLRFINEDGRFVDGGRIDVVNSFGVIVSGNYSSNVKVVAITGTTVTLTAYARLGFMIGSVTWEGAEVNNTFDPATGFTSSVTFTISEFEDGLEIRIPLIAETYSVELYNGEVKIGETITGVKAGSELSLGEVTTSVIKGLVRQGYALLGFYAYQNAGGRMYIDGQANVSVSWAENGYVWNGEEYVATSNYDPSTKTFKLYAGWERLKTAIKLSTTPITIKDEAPTVSAQVVITSLNNTNSWLDINDVFYADILYGADITIKAPVYKDYKFHSWIITLDGVVQEPIRSETYFIKGGFNCKNVEIKATYKAKIALDKAVGGFVSLSQGEVVLGGGEEDYLFTDQSFTLTATAYNGYGFKGWYNKVTGELLSEDSSYVYVPSESGLSPMWIQGRFVGDLVTFKIGEYDNTYGKVENVYYEGEAMPTEGFNAYVGDVVEILVSIHKDENRNFGVAWNYSNISYVRDEGDFKVYQYTISGNDVSENTVTVVPSFTERVIKVKFDIKLGSSSEYIKAGEVTSEGMKNNEVELSYGQPLVVGIKVNVNYKLKSIHLNGASVMEYFSNGKLTIPSGKFFTTIIGGGNFVVQIIFEEDLWIQSQDLPLNLPGMGTKDQPYLISTAEDLAFIAYQINVNKSSEYANANYMLLNDVDLYGKFWSPIGTEENPFNGNFNFAGYKVFGITVEEKSAQIQTKYGGLFGVTGDKAVFVENNNAILAIAIAIPVAVVLIAIIVIILLVIKKRRRKKLEELANS